MAMQVRKKFGEILVEAGVITEKILATALQAQKKSGLALGRILEDMAVVSAWDIATILARQFDLPCIQHIPAPLIAEDLFRVIDCDLAIEKNVFPLGIEQGLLRLAISNPLDSVALDKIAFTTGLRIKPVLATPLEIFKAIKLYYLNEQNSGNSCCDKVLVVDEDDLYRGTICANIRQAGYQPLFADNATTAVQLTLQEQPHLTLLSTTVGALNGRELFQALQGGAAPRQRPVIALSTLSSPEEEAALLSMGFFDVVFKPLNYVRLLARIERTMRFFYPDGAPSTDPPSLPQGVLSSYS